MVSKDFKSIKSKDCITLKYPKIFKDDSHTAKIFVNKYDDYKEHIKQINYLFNYAKNANIRWICLRITGKYVTPQNAMISREKGDHGKIRCHIEDFRKFYMSNMDKIIPTKCIHAIKTKRKDKDGFIIVTNKNKMKSKKYDYIKKKVKEINTIKIEECDDDWLSM